jgi:hypothetical protein
MNKSPIKYLMAAAAVACLGLAGTAKASLTIDIRVDSVSGTGVTKVDAHHVDVTGTGGTINFSVYAVISDGNSNPADDGFKGIRGYILAPKNVDTLHPGPVGNLGANALVAPFNGAGSVAGQNGIDIDGDGFNDLGTLASSASTSVAPFSASMTLGGPDFKFLTFSMPVTNANLVSGGDSIVGFTKVGITNTVVWQEDNVAKNGASAGATFNFVNATLHTVVADVPEPASVGILALGGLALLARRRKA